MIKVALIGYGYWGPNLARNFASFDNVQLEYICDTNPNRLNVAGKDFPSSILSLDSEDIFSDPGIDVVIIATPASSHYELSKKALKKRKHIFVEKPFTTKSQEASELIKIAEKNNLTIMVDHTFLFTGAIKEIKRLLDIGSIGQVFYYDSTRINLGLFQHDVNVAWDLAVHDFYIMDYLFNSGKFKKTPYSLSASGLSSIVGYNYEMAYITVFYMEKFVSHINVNWLSPVKVRKTLIGGDKQMIVWDDLEPDEKVKVYDRGADVNKDNIHQLLVSYRSGDTYIPRLDRSEALRKEVEYFFYCLSKNITPINDGAAGLRVVKMLEACNFSMERRGGEVII